MSWLRSTLNQVAANSQRVVFSVSMLTLLSIGSTQLSADVARFDVTEDDGIYSIKASVLINAPAEYVRNVLTDFVHIYRLNPSIVESEVLTSPDARTSRVRTKVLGCVAAYCEEFERVELVTVLPSGDIVAEVIPEASQFKTGVTLWKIRSSGDNTQLVYEANIEPDFFIPPIIGTALVKDRLREEISTSFTRLEQIASIQFERDWNPDRNLPELMIAGNTVPCE